MRTRVVVAGAALLLITGSGLPAPAIAQGSPERRTTIQAGAARIEVTIRGRGDAVVCIPSRGRVSEDFADLSRRLVAAGYQVILPQPRGIGGSIGPLENITYHDLADDVAAVIKTLVRGKAMVLGHGFGTRIVRTLATDHPELVRGLILLSLQGPISRAAEIESLTTRFWETPLTREERLAVVQRTFFAPGNDAGVWEGGWHFDIARAQRAADARTPRDAWWSGGTCPF